jgi:hypothetical protein
MQMGQISGEGFRRCVLCQEALATASLDGVQDYLPIVFVVRRRTILV